MCIGKNIAYIGFDGMGIFLEHITVGEEGAVVSKISVFGTE